MNHDLTLTIFSMIASGIVSLAISELYRKLPLQKLLTLKLLLNFRECQQGSRLKELVVIKNNRQDDRHYLYELQQSQNFFILLIVTAVVNFVFLLMNNFLAYPTWFFIFGMLPTYVVEFLWLNKVSYVEDLRVYQKGNLEWKKRKRRKIRYKNKKIKQLG
ncbi:hypothetical protein [Psychrobacter urativorans]|uniref:hypothetical protein n=1 Tax=Psychrobacter urativorans TaxID=45610 RepID=UPI00191A6BF8|nr:hypothetical protein [Psychrobacter urativorans]